MKKEKLQMTALKYKGSWEYYKQLYVNKLDNIEEMDGFLQRYNLTTLNQEKIEYKQINLKYEIETMIKKLQTNESPGPDCFTGKFYTTLREELAPTFLKLFQKLKRNEHFQAHSTRPSSPWYQNQTNISLKKKITGQCHWWA